MKAQHILRKGGTVEVNGQKYVIEGDGVVSEPGDIYIAERNRGPRLLTARVIDSREWIVPVEDREYCYDTWECCKVRKAEDYDLKEMV